METRRSYLAEEFPSGSHRSVSRWLKSLVDRDDVVRVWLKPVGSKVAVWTHEGPLNAVPDLDDLFRSDTTEASDTAEVEAVAA